MDLPRRLTVKEVNMFDIERELISITEYKIQRKFSDRQDYLKSLFVAVQKLTDDDFDSLSNGAAAWANACVEAHNNKRDGDLPDFDEIEDVVDEDEDDPSEDEPFDDDSTEDEEDPDEELDEDQPDDDQEEESENESPDDDPPDEDPEVEDVPQQTEMKLEVKKTVKKEKKKEVKAPPKPIKKAPAFKPSKKSKVEEEIVVLDKWGCMEGSKNSQALAMFEKGATTAEVKNAIGGTYYNILGKMSKQGHKLTKTGSVIKLTHMSEKESKVSSPKKSKK